MMSFNSNNIRNKINALNSNAKANSVPNKPSIKVSNSISEKIKKLSSTSESSTAIGTAKKTTRENEDKQLKDVKNQSSSIKTKEDLTSEIRNCSPEPNENQDSKSECPNNLFDSNENTNDLESMKKKLAEYQYINKQLRIENNTLHEELQDIRNEMDELQDQFRLDDADEFRQLQAELEIAAKNCRILQFKLRKLEKRNETLETEKIILQDRLDEFSREANKIIDLEEELLIAKEVSIRLNGELEQAHQWKASTEKLNNNLKKQLDELKDFLDNEIKNREHAHDLQELVLINQLYESMFREYFLQEQLYSISNSSQSQTVSSQLREVNDLMNSYQQKIALLNEEIDILKIQLVNKEKEMDQMKIQLKNLKRSRSTDCGYERGRKSTSNNHTLGNKATSNTSLETTGSITEPAKENNSEQIQVANDEIKLLKNKIARLEDDLIFVSQEKESFAKKLENIEKIETKFSITENDIESELCKSMEKQIKDLKKKIDVLNSEAKVNEEVRSQLSSEIKQLKIQLDHKDSSRNLTDSDKLLRDECQKLRFDLESKTESLDQLRSDLKLNLNQLNEMKKMIELKETRLIDLEQNETFLNKCLDDTKTKLERAKQKIDDYDNDLIILRNEITSKSNSEAELKLEIKRQSNKINDLSSQIKEKLSEIEFLNKENNALQERINFDEQKIKTSEEDMKKLKFKIDDLQRDLDLKIDEVVKLEKVIKLKENEFGDMNKKLTWKEQLVKDKLEQFEKNKIELADVHKKMANMAANHQDKIKYLNQEIDRLTKEKNKVNQELDEVKKSNSKKSEQIENEIKNEKIMLQKIETEALNLKYETKIQYLDSEIEAYRSRVKKLLKEKEVQDQVLKDNQKLVKEIALKYANDSDSWNRQKQKLLEKEKLYEESVEMRRELKKAADKLRLKLQNLEEQIIDNQNKHMIEKNNWESQRIQYISQNNKLEEQLSKLSTLKRSKKEIDFAWDKERREFTNQIQILENTIADLQTHLAAKNSHSNNSITDHMTQNDKLQSLQGENEFLKNRIRELEIMLDEMDQVRRFLFDLKDVYDSDRLEWIYAKDEFKNQIEIKENLLIDCNMKINELLSVVKALYSNEPVPPNVFGIGCEKDSQSMESIKSSKNQSLNNLVGGTSTLLDLKFGTVQPEQNVPKIVNNQYKYLNNEEDSDLKSIDEYKNHIDLENEFDQACKKINRVKDNLSTHKKFMDIVKSKSMKALNRKSSISSLPMSGESGKHESRCSVPPENKFSQSASSAPRAKSVSKEPCSRDSSVFAPSRFFSLGRRFAKIRFSSSSQPPPPEKSQPDESPNLKNKKSSKITQSQLIVQTTPEEAKKKNFRDRALSPSKFLRSLRPRSPFNRTNRNAKASSLAPATTTTIGTSDDISGKNKSFTVHLNDSAEESVRDFKTKKETIMSASYHSGTDRFVRANTAQPGEKFVSQSVNDKVKSLSCEFIDNQSTTSSILSFNSKQNNGLKLVNERLDEYDELDNNSVLTGSSMSTKDGQAEPKVTVRKFTGLSSTSSKVEMLRKNFMENQSQSQNSEIIKSVKFKEPEKCGSEIEEPQKIEKKSRFEETGGKINFFNSQQKLKSSVSTSNVDKPPKGPVQSVNLKTKFSSNKAKTIDFPDLLQSALESASNQKSKCTLSNGKPIQSILRRSETPPSSKNNYRQQSVESNESTRETSIEKLMRTTSTSRPLMFNN